MQNVVVTLVHTLHKIVESRGRFPEAAAMVVVAGAVVVVVDGIQLHLYTHTK